MGVSIKQKRAQTDELPCTEIMLSAVDVIWAKSNNMSNGGNFIPGLVCQMLRSSTGIPVS